MGEYKIEKNIPTPINARSKGESKYPFAQMEVGDSFVMEDRSISRANNAIHLFRKKFPEKKFVVRAVDAGFRIWRIA